MESEGDTQAHGSSVDWAEAPKSPEFCTCLAEAIAKVIGTRAANCSQVTDLEQLGDVSPSAMSSAATGTHSSSEGMLTAPSFIGVSESMSSAQSRATGQSDYSTTVMPPNCFEWTQSRPQQSFLSWYQAVRLFRKNWSRRIWRISLLKCPISSPKT